MDDTKNELEFIFLPHRLSLYVFNEKLVMFKHNTPIKVMHGLIIKALYNEQ